MQNASENPEFKNLLNGVEVMLFLEEVQTKSLATSYRTVTQQFLVIKTKGKNPKLKRI